MQLERTNFSAHNDKSKNWKRSDNWKFIVCHSRNDHMLNANNHFFFFFFAFSSKDRNQVFLKERNRIFHESVYRKRLSEQRCVKSFAQKKNHSCDSNEILAGCRLRSKINYILSMQRNDWHLLAHQRKFVWCGYIVSVCGYMWCHTPNKRFDVIMIGNSAYPSLMARASLQKVITLLFGSKGPPWLYVLIRME